MVPSIESPSDDKTRANKKLLVQYAALRTCLVNLPPRWVNALLDQNKLPQHVMLEITWINKAEGTKTAYFGWSGDSSKPLPPNAVFTNHNAKLDVLEIDPQLATAIGLSEGETITVDFCRNVPECATVSVEPYTEDDWEILELHAGYVEDNLLSQLRVVYTDQLMCVWIHDRTLVRLRVAELSPNHTYLKLYNQSEVIVSPKVRRTHLNGTTQQKDQRQKQPQGSQATLRVLMTDGDGFATVHVRPGLELGTIARVTKVIPSFVRKDTKEKKEEMPDRCKAVFCNVVESEHVPEGHVYVDASVRQSLDLCDYDIIRVASTLTKSTTPSALVVRRITTPQATTHPSSIKLGLDAEQQQKQAKDKQAQDDQRIQAVKSLLSSSNPTITSNMIFHLPSPLEETILVQFEHPKSGSGPFSSTLPTDADAAPMEAREERYATVNAAFFKSTDIIIGDDVPMATPTGAASEKTNSMALSGVDKVYDRLTSYSLASLANAPLRHALAVPGAGGVLITGAHGSGKTSIVHQLMRTVRSHPACLTYTRHIQCADIAGERIPTLKDMMQTIFDQAAWHAPSLVFFDDLDRLIPAEVEHADSTRTNHLAELFVHMAITMTRRHAILIVATAQQQQSIHPTLVSSHVLGELVHLNPPSHDERKEILQSMMKEGSKALVNSVDHVDLVSVAAETEGFLAADLKALIERAVHEGAVRCIKQDMPSTEEPVDLQLTQDDFYHARQGFVPSSLRGVKLQSSGAQWSDVGGLKETRRVLLETLEWPTKYASVFAQCPLRLRSGLLLYGYPGCGKTLLASAVAKECGLNFISVKGPEILNKYIGASEKSVRDLFERAQAAKPCVLFFDEFDSIAPRRGHDSTGVTDRVVNQMLTQMDGAEGLDGVYVLAATSRPDLIDPALLRPGRLDKALLCGMPDVEERLEIMSALARKMALAKDVDLQSFAEKTEGFTGSDLQGLLYNAHLEAIHDVIQATELKEKPTDASTANEATQFVLVGSRADSAPMTSAETTQMARRLAVIKNRSVERPNRQGDNKMQRKDSVPTNRAGEAMMTNQHLSNSLASTRPSITLEEHLRLRAIYDEFVTGRTEELPSGEGAKGIGKRTTLG